MPTEPTPISVEIKSLRDSFGESQAAFAVRCNLTQATISEAESGKYTPSAQTLLAIAHGTSKMAILGMKNGKVFVDRRK